MPKPKRSLLDKFFTYVEEHQTSYFDNVGGVQPEKSEKASCVKFKPCRISNELVITVSNFPPRTYMVSAKECNPATDTPASLSIVLMENVGNIKPFEVSRKILNVQHFKKLYARLANNCASEVIREVVRACPQLSTTTLSGPGYTVESARRFQFKNIPVVGRFSLSLHRGIIFASLQRSHPGKNWDADLYQANKFECRWPITFSKENLNQESFNSTIVKTQDTYSFTELTKDKILQLVSLELTKHGIKNKQLSQSHTLAKIETSTFTIAISTKPPYAISIESNYNSSEFQDVKKIIDVLGAINMIELLHPNNDISATPPLETTIKLG